MAIIQTSNSAKNPYHEFILASPLLFERHSFLVLLEVFSFGGLEVEPRVGKRLDVGQQGLDEGVKLVLKNSMKNFTYISDKRFIWNDTG